MHNQNPEQIAGDNIDKQLLACGWVIQDKKKFKFATLLFVYVATVTLSTFMVTDTRKC